MVLLVVVAAMYVAAAFGIALTKAPFCDEGWLASPGLNLLRHGHMETSVLEPAGSFLTGIDHYTYWVTPLWLLTTGVFYRLFGFGLTTLRSVSVFWGVAGIFACFVITRRLTSSAPSALTACAILAFDTNFILNGGSGRMDMMSAMCGAGAIAVYLCQRDRDFTTAVVVSQSLAAAGVFSHPNGVIGVLSLAFLTAYLDFSKIRWSHVLLAAIPYVLGLSLWGLYISHAPKDFVAQFAGNAKPGSRGLVFHAPLQALKLELTTRYLDGYSFEAAGWKKLRALPLLLYSAALVGCLWTPKIRKDRYARAALWLWGIAVMSLFLIDGIKRSFYLVHVLVPLAVVSAIWISWLWKQWRVARIPITAGLAALFLIQLAGIITLIRKQDRQREFQPVIAFLKNHRQTGAIVMGPSELRFGLGYDPPLTDDYRLGFFSGKRAQYIVLDDNYRALMASLKSENEPVYRWVTNTLARDYRPVWHDDLYDVLVKTLTP